MKFKYLETTQTNPHRSFLQRAFNLRINCEVLTSDELESRRTYFTEKLSGLEFCAKTETESAPLNPLADAATNDALMNMAKGNLIGYIPQTLIMGWVNYFFAGLVVMKLPFPLTEGFKSMLQNGVNTPNLTASYVSAISWYFVNLFGLRPVYSLIMNDQSAAERLITQQQQSPLSGMGSTSGARTEKIFKAEVENLQILEHLSSFEGVASRVLSQFES